MGRHGRTGEDVAQLTLAGFGPAELDRLTSADVALTEGQALAWAHAVDETGVDAVAAIAHWRSLGLPADPPDELGRVLMKMAPGEAAEWLAAGYHFDEIAQLAGLPLTVAVAWRAAGFGAAEIRQLLDADWTLLPEEVASFDTAGIASADRLRWIEDGFDAAAARAWTDLGVLPNEARVWRSLDMGPADARARPPATGTGLPPDIPELGWSAIGDPSRADRRYSVTDPPGTRGRIANDGGRRRRPGP